MKMLLLLLVAPCFLFAQDPMITAFPSLRIPTSSRGLAMGDNGIAAAVGNQQLYHNVAKAAFSQNFHQASVSYLPWLSGVSNDTRLMNANYIGNIGDNTALGLSLSYLRIGNVAMRDENGAIVGLFRASEYSLGTSFGIQVFEHASVGVTLRAIGQNMNMNMPLTIFSACGDIAYYQYLELGDVSRKIEWGVTVSNLGPKVGYSSGLSKTSLPANVGVGVGYSSVMEDNGFSISLDANKLIADNFQGVRFSLGVEYGYAGAFFLRGGVHYEGAQSGNRKFVGLGVGYKGLVADQSWGLDFHYLVPFGVVGAVSPYSDVFGFTLSFNFGNFQ
jgi:hypothetical protein